MRLSPAMLAWVCSVVSLFLGACGDGKRGADGNIQPDGHRDVIDAVEARRADRSDVDPPSSADASTGDALDASLADAVDPGADSGTLRADGGVPDGGAVAVEPCVQLNPRGELLFDPGGSGTEIQMEGERLLTLSEGWALWDVRNREILVRIPVTCDRDCAVRMWPLAILRDGVLVVRHLDRLEVRDATTGEMRAQVPFAFNLIGSLNEPPRFGVGPGASYLWAVGHDSIAAWSLSGAPLFSKTGRYVDAQVFAAAGELRVAAGAAGATVIEAITTGGVGTISPAFAGVFRRWFGDGERFLTVAGSTMRIYSRAAMPEQIVDLPTSMGTPRVGGNGQWFWVETDWLRRHLIQFFRVGGDATPVLQRESVLRIASDWVASRTPSGISIVDFSGTSLVERHQDTPWPPETVGRSRTGQVAFTSWGALFVYTPTLRVLSCGALSDMAGSDVGRLAVAAGAVQVLVIDVPGRQLEAIIPEQARALRLSADGRTLVVHPREPGMSLRVFALPEATLRHDIPFEEHSDRFVLSLSGERLVTCSRGTCQMLAISGPAPQTLWTIPAELSPSAYVRLSPNGRRLAVRVLTGETKIYDEGRLVGASQGHPHGWLDDDRVVLQTGEWPKPDNAIVDADGRILRGLPWGPIYRLELVGGGRRFLLGTAPVGESASLTINDAMTTEPVWMPPARISSGAVAGDWLVAPRPAGPGIGVFRHAP